MSLRVQHVTVWKELTEAWEYTFGVALSNESLENPASTGPNAFSDEERAWCEQTRRFFSAGGGISQALVAEGHAECILPRFGKLFPDGCMLYA